MMFKSCSKVIIVLIVYLKVELSEVEPWWATCFVEKSENFVENFGSDWFMVVIYLKTCQNFPEKNFYFLLSDSSARTLSGSMAERSENILFFASVNIFKLTVKCYSYIWEVSIPKKIQILQLFLSNFYYLQCLLQQKKL